MSPADPKPPKRIRDREALRRFRLLHLGETCERCGVRTGIHAHHEKLRSRGGDDIAENLRWLCGQCHDAAHGIRSVW